jgi:hypothetical protein
LLLVCRKPGRRSRGACIEFADPYALRTLDAVNSLAADAGGTLVPLIIGVVKIPVKRSGRIRPGRGAECEAIDEPGSEQIGRGPVVRSLVGSERPEAGHDILGKSDRSVSERRVNNPKERKGRCHGR